MGKWVNKWVWASSVLLPAVIAANACSADTGAGGPGSGSGGKGGSSGAGGEAAGGAGGDGGSGAIGSGGTGSGVGIDASSGGTSGGGQGGTCSEIKQQAENKLQPADIVFALDNSGSMDEEAKFVQTHMNAFSTGIVQANIDAHVVILSASSNQSNGVCIGTPLGSGSCPNDDNPPNFLHLDVPVGSSNSLQLLVDQFDNYKAMLRPGASKHFVVVTDDNSSMNAVTFNTAIVPKLQSVDPLYSKYTFHAIYSFTNPNPLVCFGNPNADPCCDKNGIGTLSADIGTVYGQLVQSTGGVKGNLCLQNFLPVFSAVSQSVVQSSSLACEWDIPPPAEGGTIDPGKVNVEFSYSGKTQPLGYVGSAADCAKYQGGWYYDDPVNPKKIFVCPETCQVLQSLTDAQINILLGCKTEVAVPK